MKHQTTFATLALLAALVIPGQTTAQGAQQEGKPHHHKYRLIDLGTFGGPQGFINPSGNETIHQQRWRRCGYRADSSSSSAEQ